MVKSVSPIEPLINIDTLSLLTSKAPWASLHGAKDHDLGAGMIYYALVYSFRSKVCVCLGSGDGFVPKIMRQAQRDLKLEGSYTLLVDGNMGSWGRPIWHDPSSEFRRLYPEIKISYLSTQSFALNAPTDLSIHYLHIDADRRVQSVIADFDAFLPYMTSPSVITIHDTGPKAPCKAAIDLLRQRGYTLTNFEHLGMGFSLLYLP